MSRGTKIVVAKSAFKRHLCTRTLAKKLTAKKHPVSKSAIYRYLKTYLQLKPLKVKLQRMLTEDQKRWWMESVKARKNWTVQGWRRIIFSDESHSRFSKRPTDRTTAPGPTAARSCWSFGRSSNS